MRTLSWLVLAGVAWTFTFVAPGAESATLREFSVPASTEAIHLRVPVGAVSESDRLDSTLVLTEVPVGDRRLVPVIVSIGADGLPQSNRLEALVSILPRSGAGGEGVRRFAIRTRSTVEAGDIRQDVGLEGGGPGGWPGGRVDGHEKWMRARPGLLSEKPGPNLRFRDDPQIVSLSVLGRAPVFEYRHGTVLKPGVPADRARSSYLHPLYGLDGEVLTDDFPEDHHHHRGVFWSWPHVGVGGKEYDLWMLRGIGHRFERFLGCIEAKQAGAVLGVENGWYVGGTRVMQERIWITTFPEVGDGRAIDLDCTWIPVDQPVTLAGAEGKSYGGMTLRYAPGTNTVITTPRGNGTEDLYMTRLPWADLSRRWADSGKVSGAALMVAPDHPDFPPTWLTRHYGVLCLGWPGVKAQTFPPGVPIRCRYRIWVHRGVVGQARLEAVYRAYADGWKPVE